MGMYMRAYSGGNVSVLTNRQQHNPQVALAVAGQLEPVEPAYYKPVAPSPISAQMAVPSEPTEWKAPVVMRGQRKIGMRYLYARGAVRQPISPLGTGPDIGQAVWSSDFQPDFMGTIHDAGFNDALFQAGYPGYNLGLSFKVQQLAENPTGGPGANIKMHTPNVLIKIQNLASGKGIVQTTG
jgi:hypothetical protein